jgi:hypothetical protein
MLISLPSLPRGKIFSPSAKSPPLSSTGLQLAVYNAVKLNVTVTRAEGKHKKVVGEHDLATVLTLAAL